MHIHHVGIKAKDINRSLDFYTRILGFKKVPIVEVLGLEFFFITDGIIKIEIEASNPGDQSINVDKHYGLSHQALEVDDLNAFASRLRKEDVRFILEPVQLREDRKIAFIEDPDGIRIQLIEFLDRK